MTAKVPRQRSGGPPSRWVDLGGPVHYVDYGGPDDGPLMVCVHGLGGSLVNWAAVAPTLSKTCRVLALDLAGFGRTRSHGRSTSVHANQQLLHRFLTEVCGGSGHPGRELDGRADLDPADSGPPRDRGRHRADRSCAAGRAGLAARPPGGRHVRPVCRARSRAHRGRPASLVRLGRGARAVPSAAVLRRPVASAARHRRTAP